jgi:hypothetical protein
MADDETQPTIEQYTGRSASLVSSGSSITLDELRKVVAATEHWEGSAEVTLALLSASSSRPDESVARKVVVREVTYGA